MSLKGNNESTTFVSPVPSIPGRLRIPNVQEMVKREAWRVPEIYIRNNIDMGNAIRMHHLSPQIPIIDLAMLRNGSKEELLKLDMACKDWGFFQLKNGVQSQLFQAMKDATAHFLNLPLEEKEKYAMPKQNMEGYGHTQVYNKEHKLDWSDALLLLIQPIHSRNYSFWPQTPMRYKDIIDKYSSEVNQVGVELINYLSMIVGKANPIPLGSPVYFFANYYPPCNKPDRVLCMSQHFDANSITLMMQDQDDVTELEIKHKGCWVPVPPIHDALVCNIGDFIEKWSNERYKSVEHRVVANKTKVRSVHEVILMPSIEKMVEPNTVGDLVNRYLQRR